jgi:tetratricopeptide (TPR) repeat protein
VKKPQWIVVIVGIGLVAAIYTFGKIVPAKNSNIPQSNTVHEPEATTLSADTIIMLAKKQLKSEQVIRLNTLENSISRGDVKDQQLKVYHQLAHFWADSAGVFEPYAWYEAQAARLENSEKSLTFAAHLFLENLQGDEVVGRRRWKALQAKDLFERSLKINPENDSSKVGLGACYLFGNISEAPMEGIGKIMEVLQKDSTNIYAQITLAKGAVMSGQYDKAIHRLQLVNGLAPDNAEATLMLADVFERTGDKKNAITWYRKSLDIISSPDAKKEIQQRIDELSK